MCKARPLVGTYIKRREFSEVLPQALVAILLGFVKTPKISGKNCACACACTPTHSHMYMYICNTSDVVKLVLKSLVLAKWMPSILYLAWLDFDFDQYEYIQLAEKVVQKRVKMGLNHLAEKVLQKRMKMRLNQPLWGMIMARVISIWFTVLSSEICDCL